MRKLKAATKQQILQELPANAKPIAELRDGRHVIGRHVDADNHLHFVVKDRDGTTEVVDAQGIGVARFLGKPVGHTQTIKNPANTATKKNKETIESEPKPPRAKANEETTTAVGLDHGRASE
jgi:hypothetical protein